MCGIAGWITAPGATPPPGTLERMLDAIAHRGPDGHGLRDYRATSGHQVALGHRRLAIIDPEGAFQPMTDEAAGLSLTFNGEIYNFRELREQLVAAGYRFQRDSDTEVLLRGYQHWGLEVLHRLRGMFAFALWDARAQRLFLARDRFGEKPLFLHERGGNLFFGSEIKSLLQVPGITAQVDMKGVWDYLAYRYVPAPRTLFEGVRKLMPASYAVWEKGRLHEQRYWTPPDQVARDPQSQGREDPGEFLERLEESVRLQMVSDVPFGAFLSGGLDSSMIVGLMARQSNRVKTFSVGFRDPRYSELSYAGQVAKHFGTDHTELVIDPRDVIEELPRLVAFRDAPVAEPSDIAVYRLAKEARKSVKMVLTGEGSDEVLGGYPKHVAEGYASGYQRLPRGLRQNLIEPLVGSLPYGFRRAKTAMANLALEDRGERYVRWFGALDGRERASLAGANLTAQAGAPVHFDSMPGNSTLRSILHFDQSSWLPDNLLERGDRMTMAASIENRVPFLDHKLAEYVSGLPDTSRVRGTKTKWILREAGKRLLPENILKRPKVGFRVPVNEWFRGPMKGYLEDHLRGSDSITRKYYQPEVLDRMIDEHVQGKQNREKLLWTLLNLEVWHRQHAFA